MGFEGKMKWYKFLTYFYVWLSAILGVLSLIAVSAPLKVCFVVITVLFVVAGVGLLSYKWYGVWSLAAGYVINEILLIFMNPGSSQMVGALIGLVVIVPLNYVYFNKRRGLFS